MKKVFIMFLTTGIVFNACKKGGNDDNPDPEPTACKISSVASVSDDGTVTSNFTYDAQNRTTAGSGGDYNQQVSISYASDKITVTTADNSQTDYYYLQSGRITRSEHFTPYPTAPQTKQLEVTYQYNTDGYLDKVTRTDVNVTATIEYSNGNISAVKSPATSEWNEDENTAFTYSTDPFSSFYIVDLAPFHYINFSTAGLDFPQALPILYQDGYLGKVSKNQISQVSVTGADEADVRKFVYEKDDKGNVTAVKVNENVADSQYGVTYKISYDCD